MRKFCLGFVSAYFLGCGDPAVMDEAKRARISLKDESGVYFEEPRMATYSLSAAHEGTRVGGTFTLSLSCDNVYGTDQTGDWAQSNVIATTSVSVPANANCHLTLTSYDDGTDTWTPVSTPLTMSVSNLGVVTAPTSVVKYESGPLSQWFSGSQSAAFSIQFNYAADAVTATTSITPIVVTIQTISLAITSVTAPVVADLMLFNVPAINDDLAGYTLVATVTGATSCKYVDNTAGNIDPASWDSVNAAFTSILTPPTTCPSFTPTDDGSLTGNWTGNYGGVGQKTLIMWANTVGGLSAYTTANF